LFYTMFYFLLLLLFFISLFVLLFFISMIWGVIYGKGKGAPWVPLANRQIERLLAVAEDYTPGEVLYDLGSGDGRVLLRAARRLDFKQFKGVEIGWFLYLVSKLKVSCRGRGKKVRFKCGDIFKENLREADVVVLYLFPSLLKRLKDKFFRELKPGAVVISVGFRILGWEPERVDQEKKGSPIYVYKIREVKPSLLDSKG